MTAAQPPPPPRHGSSGGAPVPVGAGLFAPTGIAGGPRRKRTNPWRLWLLGSCGCGLIGMFGLVMLSVLGAILRPGSPERTVRDYQRAWEETDCELFFDSTTDRFREGATCEDFVQVVEASGRSTDSRSSAATSKGSAR